MSTVESYLRLFYDCRFTDAFGVRDLEDAQNRLHQTVLVVTEGGLIEIPYNHVTIW